MKIEFNSQAEKFLKKCDSLIQIRIENKIDSLLKNPNPTDAKTINSKEGKLFRVRVGDYRIIYKIDWQANYLIILFIEKRSKIYGYVKDEEE